MSTQIPRHRPATEIKVTREMVDAGLVALDYCRGAFSEEETVREVYIAMARASARPHEETA